MSDQKVEFHTKAGFFFIFTFSWSLVFWFLTVISGGIRVFPGSILQYFGGAGPVVAALAITHFFEPRTKRREFWARTFDPRRIPARWLLAALIVHPAILLFAAAVDKALGGEIQLKIAGLNSPVAWINLVFFVFIFGPLPEEMGWRGVGYERLRVRRNAIEASLFLGIAWALWHVPLFLIEGTFQQQLGFGSGRFWIFLLSNVPLTILITWVYIHTERSILSAALMHFSGNIVGALLVKSSRLALIELAGLTLVAIVIIAMTGLRPEDSLQSATDKAASPPRT